MITAKNKLATALIALVLVSVLAAGCGRKPEPAAPPAAPGPASFKPVAPAPGETPSASLLKKEDAPHIKVKRDKEGEVTWEITGKDVRAIIDADRALRRGFVPKEKPGTD
jgi:hypothetical protein